MNSSLGHKILIAVEARKSFPFFDPKNEIITTQMQAVYIFLIPEMAEEYFYCHANRQSLLSMQVFQISSLPAPKSLFR